MCVCWQAEGYYKTLDKFDAASFYSLTFHHFISHLIWFIDIDIGDKHEHNQKNKKKKNDNFLLKYCLCFQPIYIVSKRLNVEYV